MTDAAQSDPWANIAPNSVEGQVNSRRANPEHPLAFYWARDHAGRYCFLLRTNQPIQDRLPKPALADIDITIASKDERDGMLLLVLGKSTQRDLFRIICRDLMRETVSVVGAGQEPAAVAVILNRLRRWQDLLKVRNQGLLSRQEQLGLLGELQILDSMFLRNLGPREAVAAWRGPGRGEQDFGYGQWLLEVKTQLSTSDQVLQISSLAQLDNRSGTIVVCHHTFASCSPDDIGGLTLRGIAATLRARLLERDQVAADIFDATLFDAGYEDREEYGQLFYRPLQRRFFRVVDAFPRLVPANVPVGIRSVKYEVELSTCTSFEIEGEVLEGEMFSYHGAH
jgi:hypothetical protein